MMKQDEWTTLYAEAIPYTDATGGTWCLVKERADGFPRMWRMADGKWYVWSQNIDERFCHPKLVAGMGQAPPAPQAPKKYSRVVEYINGEGLPVYVVWFGGPWYWSGFTWREFLPQSKEEYLAIATAIKYEGKDGIPPHYTDPIKCASITHKSCQGRCNICRP